MALVLSASTKSTPDNVHTVLSEMDKSKFGQSILSFLSLNTAAEVPVDEILQVLEEVSDQIQNRQADADAYNNTNQALCDEALNNLGNQLATEADTISTLENTINVEGSNRDNAKRELNQAATDYDETVNALDSGNAQREAEHEKWVNTDYEHEQGLVAIEETIKLIKHMLHGVTFAQIKSRYEKVQETLRGTSKFGTLFKPLILGLSELATKLNYESVVKILDLLNNIHAALTESRTNYRLTEEKAAADWDSLSSTLSDQKQALAD